MRARLHVSQGRPRLKQMAAANEPTTDNMRTSDTHERSVNEEKPSAITSVRSACKLEPLQRSATPVR